jgi:hypothetical protein
VALRPDENALLPRSSEYGDFQYRLSTTAEDELSQVFAENVGPDETIVFDRSPFTISAREIPDLSEPGPRDFDYVYEFDTPFFYDPGTGRNLVIEARSESGYLNEGPKFDVHSDSFGIFAADVNALESTNGINSLVREFTFAPFLYAGDADQDLDFDQLDLVHVQIGGKYLSGQTASWGEGDWNGAPGGYPGNPPQGDGLFNQLDIIAAQQAGVYLTGSYAVVEPNGQANDGQTSILYNAGSGELAVDAPAGTELTSINIDSVAGIFTGSTAENLGGSFDNDADNNVFKATFGGSFGSLSFGNVAQPGLAENFLLGDLTVVGSLAGGGALGNVDLIYIPEPSSFVLLALSIVLLGAFVASRTALRPRVLCYS